MFLSSKISEFKLTKPQIEAFLKLKINTVEDLLLFLPYKYMDFSNTKKVKDLVLNENVTLKVKVKSISSRFAFKSRMSLAEALVCDDTACVKVVWFNQPYLVKNLKVEEEIFLSGQAENYNNVIQLNNPLYEKVSDFPIHTGRLLPLYHLTKNLYLKTIRQAIAKIISLSEEILDPLPKNILESQNLLNKNIAIKLAHFPENLAQVYEVKKRLAFEEIFFNQLLVQRHKMQLQNASSLAVPFNQKITKRFVESLPFKLTNDQKRATWQCLQDLELSSPANRLVEGDVGSGKTLLALICALNALFKGYQVAFLCPTEILARQHHETVLRLLVDKKLFFNCRSILLTQKNILVNRKEYNKKELFEEVRLGMPGLYIGTHALLQKSLEFKNLSLVIIDEQHRFGVKQRAELLNKSEPIPHLISLSATPIPRSLQLAFYGDLNISQIKTKPENRKNIITKLVKPENREKAYGFIKSEIQQGRQAFVITPRIEEVGNLAVKSVKKEQQALQSLFPEFTVGLLHGKLKQAEKEKVMENFLENNIQILVATSVVEVGVDVPNASVMVIEGAERFGLAQLHQFRGRVGRSEYQSYCFLFLTENTEQNLDSLERLEGFTKVNDGFELSELDLKLRGFGELYGSLQSGINFKYFSNAYLSLIPKAREEAIKLLKEDLLLTKYPFLAKEIENKIVHLE